VGSEDASKMLNTGESIAITSGAELLSIEGRQMPVIKDTLQLYVAKLTKAQYTLQIFAKELEGKVQAFLEDSYLNTVQPLTLTDTNRIVFNVMSADAASSASDRFKITFAQQLALPVRYVSTYALENNGNVDIKWRVADETGILKHEVERSVDGRSFIKIGEVPAKNATGIQSYELKDGKVSTGSFYYRIKAIQGDGKNYYSKVVSVTIGKSKAEIKVSPNPVKNQRIYLKMTGIEGGKYNAVVINKQGQIVASTTVNYSGGSSNIIIAPDRRLSAGVYSLKLVNGNKSYYDSFVIE
jgi:hypothetical protein